MLVKNSSTDNDVSWVNVVPTYISETEPTAPAPYVWYQIDQNGNIVDILIAR
jgi:hypothetical protein